MNKKNNILTNNISKLRLLMLKNNYAGLYSDLQSRIKNNPDWYNTNQITGEKSIMYGSEK